LVCRLQASIWEYMQLAGMIQLNTWQVITPAYHLHVAHPQKIVR